MFHNTIARSDYNFYRKDTSIVRTEYYPLPLEGLVEYWPFRNSLNGYFNHPWITTNMNHKFIRRNYGFHNNTPGHSYGMEQVSARGAGIQMTLPNSVFPTFGTANTQFTLAFWFSSRNNSGAMFQQGTNWYGHKFGLFDDTGSHILMAGLRTSGINRVQGTYSGVSGADPVNNNNPVHWMWYHYTLTLDKTISKYNMYINAQKVVNNYPSSGVNEPGGGNFYLFYDTEATTIISRLCLYNRILAPDEISMLYNDTLEGGYSYDRRNINVF